MTARAALLALLADGACHSGADLAARVGVTRAAIWKQLRGLARYGVRVEALRGRGYRLDPPVELLDAERLHAGLSPAGRGLLQGLDVLWETDSTNTRLLEAAARSDITGHVCIAEFQSAGRGRRGRHWDAPLGSGVCLSIGWRYAVAPSALGTLSLAIGVAAAEALQSLGLDAIGLKWPNDLVVADRKLGGILLDLRAEGEGPSVVVAGIGINVHLPEDPRRAYAQPWTDLRRVTGRPVARHDVAVALIDHLLRTLNSFAADGFEPLRERWSALDAIRDRRIAVHGYDRVMLGRARGVDADGALLVEVEGEPGLRRFLSGDVSVRID